MDYRKVFTISRLWLIFGIAMAVMFSVLLAVGGRIYQQAPPMPQAVVTTNGDALFTLQDIRDGQDVWRRLGGMQLGSVWGHGAYLAPDWTADVLHREAEAILDRRAGGDLDSVGIARRAGLIAEFTNDIRKNTYNAQTGEIVITPERAAAIQAVISHYRGLFGSPQYQELRKDFAIAENPLGDLADSPNAVRTLTAFWWWSAWSAVTLRPGDDVSYTNNWPHEPLVGNTPSASMFLWSFLSVILLIACIGALCWFFNRQREAWNIDLTPDHYPQSDPLDATTPTPSMRAVRYYILVVVLLLAAQIILGTISAHYAVEGQDFYGIPLSETLPYSLARTWHTQLAVLWIATAWLGAGLYAAPLILGREPRGQLFGVSFLLVALVIAVVGSMVGEWMTVNGYMTDPTIVFWFGYQGYEYLDLGRFWQILIFVGLLLWLALMARCILPAIRRRAGDHHLLALLLISSAAVGLLYGAGLLYDRETHLSIAEYWRWWVVHLWVEGVFEVFATAWIAWIFVRMQLLRAHTAAIYAMFSAMVFLGGGVLGTFHHLYFSGTPESVVALGAMFSALEVVPLALIAFEAHDHWKVERDAAWAKRYHMPLMFFLAVAFWNLVGAGVLGFLINPPLALYYLQGLQTTPAHGHAALFGVYGMMGIGFALFCRRGLAHDESAWSDRVLKWVFWLFNGGLALMVFGSLLPQGLVQAYVSFSESYWSARSPELMHSPLIEQLVWLRVPGDIVFALGAFLLVAFLFRLERKKSHDSSRATAAE